MCVIKTCPFCGDDPEIEKKSDVDNYTIGCWKVFCSKSECLVVEFESYDFSTLNENEIQKAKEYVIKVWNSRKE